MVQEPHQGTVMAQTKECSWPGCARHVEKWKWGCATHFHMLPVSIQEKITLQMSLAAEDAAAWIRRTFGDEIKERWNPGRWETLLRFVRDRDEARVRRRAAVASP
jgi:hypothetical protein